MQAISSLPVHPLVVHFPIVLAVLLPLFAVGALWAIRRGTAPRRAWAIPIALSALLCGSAWVSVETGEQQGERVERVVPERPMEAHEEAAELFLSLTAGLLLLSGAGMASGRIGAFSRGAATAAAVSIVVAAVSVGHSGGQLVYQYNAASVYNQSAPPVAQAKSDRTVAGGEVGER